MRFGLLNVAVLALSLLCVDARRSQRVFGLSEYSHPQTNFPLGSVRRRDRKKVPPTTQPSTAAAVQTRGGATSDSDAILWLKVLVSAAAETGALLSVFYTSLMLGAFELAENCKMGKVFGLPISYWASILVVVFGSSFFGSLVDGGMSVATQQALDPNVVPGDSAWYANLKKPFWNPPGWVFPIMWLIVSKPTQVVALSKLLKASGESFPWNALAVYCAHLSLGDAWNKVFFGFQYSGKGAAVITAFFGLLLTSAYLFSGVDPDAGKFLFPTCGWVFVASSLNWYIYLNN